MDGGAIAVRAKEAGLAELYATYGPGAAQLAYLLTGDKHLAEDIVQEAFVKLLGRFEHLRRQESFQAYLNRVVVNLTRKHWRRKDLERRYATGEASLRARDTLEVRDVETSDELWAAVQQLPYRQRAAIVLRFYEDLSEHQTAELLDCSPKAVRSLVGRAKESLRALSEQGALG